MDFALSRIRQLSAHEIGHTLGFAHNVTTLTDPYAAAIAAAFRCVVIRFKMKKPELGQRAPSRTGGDARD